MFTSTYKDLTADVLGSAFVRLVLHMAFIGLALVSLAARRVRIGISDRGILRLRAGNRRNRELDHPESGRPRASPTILAQPFMVAMTGFLNWLWDVHTSPRQVPNPSLARGGQHEALSEGGVAQ